MEKKGITFYGVLVYIAYSFYILMGATWFVVSFFNTGHFNLQAFMLTLVFSVQAWFKNVLTNLILGILSLALSIFMLLQEIEAEDLFAKGIIVNFFTRALLTFSFVSIAMSLILIFSYIKFGFKDN